MYWNFFSLKGTWHAVTLLPGGQHSDSAALPFPVFPTRVAAICLLHWVYMCEASDEGRDGGGKTGRGVWEGDGGIDRDLEQDGNCVCCWRSGTVAISAVRSGTWSQVSLWRVPCHSRLMPGALPCPVLPDTGGWVGRSGVIPDPLLHKQAHVPFLIWCRCPSLLLSLVEGSRYAGWGKSLEIESLLSPK